MKALILAAGRGSRMKSLTGNKPKCLIELNGRPLIELQLEAIRAAGIDEIAIVTGYKSEMLGVYNLERFHNDLWEQTQMVFSLSCASQWLDSGPCIVSYSDIFYEKEIVELLKSTKANLALAFDPRWLELWQGRFDDPLEDAETFCLNDDNTVADIGGVPISLREIQGQYMGLLKFEPDGWHALKDIFDSLNIADQKSIDMTSILQKLIEKRVMPIQALETRGAWGELDSQSDVEFFSN